MDRRSDRPVRLYFRLTIPRSKTSVGEQKGGVKQRFVALTFADLTSRDGKLLLSSCAKQEILPVG